MTRKGELWGERGELEGERVGGVWGWSWRGERVGVGSDLDSATFSGL